VENYNIFKYKDVFLTEEEINILRDYILKNEEYVKSLGADNYGATSDNSLTGRYKYFNYLNSDIGKILTPKLISIFSYLKLKYPISVLCWANTFRYGEGIKMHSHSHREYLSANIFISGNTLPGTTYFLENPPIMGMVDIENVPGEMCIFSSQIMHGVKENYYENVRISMALDIHEKTDYSSQKNYYVFKK